MQGYIYTITEEEGKSVIEELWESIYSLGERVTYLEEEIVKYVTLERFESEISRIDASLATKQDTLVSGENIKTLNGESLLGSGNIEIKEGVKVFDLPNLHASDSVGMLYSYTGDVQGAIVHLGEFSFQNFSIKRFTDWDGSTKYKVSLSTFDTPNKSFSDVSFGSSTWLQYLYGEAKGIDINSESTAKFVTALPNRAGFGMQTIGVSDVQGLSNSLDAKADLIDGKVPVGQLPSSLDDVREYDSLDDMPQEGESDVIYIAKDTNRQYRYDATDGYVELNEIKAATELEVNRLFRTEYAIVATITNGSASGDTSIWTKETAEVTIVPSSGYVLPGTITVSGATYTYDNSTGVVSLSDATGSVTIVGECTPVPPTKGDIITLDGGTARYRVLKTSGTISEVLALDDVANSAFNGPVETTFSDGSVGLKYENSVLDTYMNSTFYNSLSSNIKAAIVQKAITQSMYKYNTSEISGYDFAMTSATTSVTSGTSWYKRIGQVSVGNRYCYALDLDDVAEYLGAESGNTVSGADLNDMFFERTPSIKSMVWLDSAYKGNSSCAYNVHSELYVVISSYYDSRVVRPAFQVDLSKVSWSKE